MYKGIIFDVVTDPRRTRSLGPHRIANHLRQQGLDIEVVDWATFFELEELKELFKSRYNSNLKFIGFSQLFTYWTPKLEAFCEWVKTNYSHVYIIAGSASSPSPHYQSNYIDYYIRGYGEKAIDVLLKWLLSNGPSPVFRLDGPAGGKLIDAIHNYPAFPMESLMTKYEDRDFLEPWECLTIEFSRGCIFKCAFCNFPVLGVKDDYSRSVEDFDEQIRDTYDRFGIKTYLVSDETFNDRPSKIRKFADAVQALPFRPAFGGFIRADLLISRPQDRHDLLDMNFIGHFYGIESLEYESAKSIGKGMKTEKLLDGLIDVRKFFETNGQNRYRGNMSLIAGLPYDTADTMKFTEDWLMNNWKGQSFQVWPLIVPKGGYDKLSTLSLDYKKYGYEPLSENEIKELSSIRKNSPGNDYETMLWKNKNMDIFQASDWKDHFTALYETDDFKPDWFDITEFLKRPHTLDEKLDLTVLDLAEQIDGSKERVRPYINKKLSL
jgi:hypothetical protein